jgi:hypothetical protein
LRDVAGVGAERDEEPAHGPEHRELREIADGAVEVREVRPGAGAPVECAPGEESGVAAASGVDGEDGRDRDERDAVHVPVVAGRAAASASAKRTFTSTTRRNVVFTSAPSVWGRRAPTAGGDASA